MTEKLRDVLRLVREQKYNDALDVIEELQEAGPIPPSLLVQKGILIQLSENSSYTTSDVEKAFAEALKIDEDYVEAINELAYFYYAVLDDAAKAKPLFERAYEICKSQMTEAVTGFANCIYETDGRDKALEFVNSVLHEPLDMEEITTLKQELMAE